MTDKTQWPQVDLPFLVGAPLAKMPRERLREKESRDGTKVDIQRKLAKKAMRMKVRRNMTMVQLQPMQREGR
jgi:hypothetical protein